MAIEIFGKSEQDALNVVELIAQNTLNRIIYIDQIMDDSDSPV